MPGGERQIPYGITVCGETGSRTVAVWGWKGLEGAGSRKRLVKGYTLPAMRSIKPENLIYS